MKTIYYFQLCFATNYHYFKIRSVNRKDAWKSAIDYSMQYASAFAINSSITEISAETFTEQSIEE